MRYYDAMEFYKNSDLPKKIYKDGTCIRVMSSNVLFSASTEGIWAERATMLSCVYLNYRPDFLGLQECDPNMTAVISDLIKDKYEIVRYTRPKEGINRHNYTPIFYYKGRWEQVDGGWFLFERGCWTMTWAVLQSKENPEVRCLHANLHQTPWGGEELMNCSIAINGELKRLREKYPNVPIYVGGDYNCERTWEAFPVLIDGVEIETAGQLAETSDSLGRHTHKVGQPLNEVETKGSIDHICVDGKLVNVKLYRAVFDDILLWATDHAPVFIDTILK
ncbi:MAG: hypothetical protein J6B71_04180 [Clostridia bacterium]|nr:hypothetical protein [Clostridia bacterium]